MKLILLLSMLPLIPLMAWLDRQRGRSDVTEIIPKIVALAGLGVCVSLLVGHYWDWQAPIIVAAVAIGYALGWGNPVGRACGGPDNGKYERWQVGILRRNVWLALAVRGSFVGLFTLVAFDPVASLKIIAAFTIVFPLAPFLVTRAFQKSGDPAWAEQEYWRGGMAGVILFGLVQL
mgnify:CR=1 FL=1